MRNDTDGKKGYGVNRILLLSPEPSELSRRSGSRIFIAIAGESVIDSILFQTQRPMENYIEAAGRAISLSELTPWKAESITLKPAFNPNVAPGLFQEHLIANDWVQDEQNEAYDVFIELQPHGFENLQPLGFETVNSNPVNGYDDDPLIFKVGIEELGPELDLSETIEHLNMQEPGDRVPGGMGRVKDAATDRRLTQNREPQLESARLSQTRDDNNDQERQHGRPGRVRNPIFDMRRRENRELAAAGR